MTRSRQPPLDSPALALERALMEALLKNSHDDARAAIERGATGQFQGLPLGLSKRTALMEAALRSDVPMIDLVLPLGCADQRDGGGNTALSVSVWNPDSAVAARIASATRDYGHFDLAVSTAIIYELNDALKALIPWLRQPDRAKALRQALLQFNAEAAILLAPLAPEIQGLGATTKGRSLLMMAASLGNEDLVALLLPRENPFVVDADGLTAADHARKEGRELIAGMIEARALSIVERGELLALPNPCAMPSRARPRI